jgi:hypothetical protein
MTLQVGRFLRPSRINTLITMTGVPAINQKHRANTQHNGNPGLSGGARPHQQHRQQHAHHAPKPQQAHAPPPSTATSHLSSTTFASIPNLSRESQRALSEVMGFNYMTEVQVSFMDNLFKPYVH